MEVKVEVEQQVAQEEQMEQVVVAVEAIISKLA